MMAQKAYNLVDDATGRIVGSIVGDTDLDTGLLTDNTPMGHTFYEGQIGDNASTLYYVGGVRTTRPLLTSICTWNKTSIISNGTDTATFGSVLPNPTVVVTKFMGMSITSQSMIRSIQITDGSLSINTTIAGQYEVVIEVFPYQRYTQIITAS